MTADAGARAALPRWWVASRVLVVLAIVALGLLALRPFVYTWSVAASYPYQLDREEGYILNQAMQLKAGRTIYPDLKDYPYTVGNYPPVFPALYAAVLGLGGSGIGVGRFLVMCFVAGIVLAMAGIVHKLTRSPAAAMLAPLLFLVTYELNYWMPFARVDLPALFFSLLGFLLFCRPGTRWLVASAAAFAVAVYTKQTQLAAPLACGAALAWARRWRDLGVFAGVWVGVGALVGFSLLAITGGEFWRHLVSYNKNEFDWGGWLKILPHIVRMSLLPILVVLVLAPATVATARREEPPRDSGLTALLAYFVLAVLSIVSIGKAGSDMNYLLEADAVLALVAAVQVGRGLGWKSPARWQAASLVTAAALLFAHGVYTTIPGGGPVPGTNALIFRPRPTAAQREQADQLLLLVDSTKGEVLSEDPTYLMLARKPVLYQPFIMSQLAKEGKWDQSPFLRDLEAGRFPLIITYQDLSPGKFVEGFTDDMRSTILKHYRQEGVSLLYGRFGPTPHFVYTPIPDTPNVK